MNTSDSRNEVFTAMNTGKPYASYKKTILGQVRVTIWNNFIGSPEELIIKGNPRAKDDSCIVDVWSEQEKVFFERLNRKQFQAGNIIPFSRPAVKEVKEKALEQFTDEELETIVNSKFFALAAAINKTESIAVLFRMMAIAEDNEKSEKVIRAIEARISELQAKEYAPVKVEE